MRSDQRAFRARGHHSFFQALDAVGGLAEGYGRRHCRLAELRCAFRSARQLGFASCSARRLTRRALSVIRTDAHTRVPWGTCPGCPMNSRTIWDDRAVSSSHTRYNSAALWCWLPSSGGRALLRVCVRTVPPLCGSVLSPSLPGACAPG